VVLGFAEAEAVCTRADEVVTCRLGAEVARATASGFTSRAPSAGSTGCGAIFSGPRATTGNEIPGRRPKPSIPIASAATQANATTAVTTAAYRNRRARRPSVATKKGRSVGVVTIDVIALRMPKNRGGYAKKTADLQNLYRIFHSYLHCSSCWRRSPTR
jgi:hypothetical protein